MESIPQRERSRSPARRPADKDPPSVGILFEPADFKYVDKTFLLAKLMARKGPHCTPPYLFAPAPRRVGKSTTVAMLAAMARGEQEKFEGMAVMRDDSPFKIGERNFQVVQLNFSGLVNNEMDLEGVRGCVRTHLLEEARKQHGINVEGTSQPSHALKLWLDELKGRGHPLVVLIDEYDAPVATFLSSTPELAEKVAQSVFKPFYEVLKNADVYKLFVTGVANLAGTSLFSGFNNIWNIMQEDVSFATLYGFTQKEITDTYGDTIRHRFGEKQLDFIMQQLKDWYNGYQAHPKQTAEDKVYNPWSVLCYFQTQELKGYWVATAVQTSLVELLGLHGIGILAEYTICAKRLFANISVKNYLQQWQQVAFHSGYATIKSNVDGVLTMGPPNNEVREWLRDSMADYLLKTMDKSNCHAYAKALEQLDLEGASKNLQAMVRSLGGHLQPRNEADFTNIVIGPLICAKPMGIDVEVEVLSQVKQPLEGEKYAHAKVPDVILWFRAVSLAIVMELKVNKAVDEAITQIKERKYVERASVFIVGRASQQGVSPPTRIRGLGVAVRVVHRCAEVTIHRAD